MNQVVLNHNVGQTGRYQQLTSIHDHRSIQTLSVGKIRIEGEFVVDVMRLNHPNCTGNAPGCNGPMFGPEVYFVENLVQDPSEGRIEQTKSTEFEKFNHHDASVPIIFLDSPQQSSIQPFLLERVVCQLKIAFKGQKRHQLIGITTICPISTKRSH
jgi:hypothetical protein